MLHMNIGIYCGLTKRVISLQLPSRGVTVEWRHITSTGCSQYLLSFLHFRFCSYQLRYFHKRIYVNRKRFT
jgi:hypothetical protein